MKVLVLPVRYVKDAVVMAWTVAGSVNVTELPDVGWVKAPPDVCDTEIVTVCATPRPESTRPDESVSSTVVTKLVFLPIDAVQVAAATHVLPLGPVGLVQRSVQDPAFALAEPDPVDTHAAVAGVAPARSDPARTAMSVRRIPFTAVSSKSSQSPGW